MHLWNGRERALHNLDGLLNVLVDMTRHVPEILNKNGRSVKLGLQDKRGARL